MMLFSHWLFWLKYWRFSTNSCKGFIVSLTTPGLMPFHRNNIKIKLTQNFVKTSTKKLANGSLCFLQQFHCNSCPSGITEITFWWIFQNSYYMESLQIIHKFCAGPLAIFLNMAYIFMQVKRNAKQSFADVLENRRSEKFRKFHKKRSILESLFKKVADLKA